MPVNQRRELVSHIYERDCWQPPGLIILAPDLVTPDLDSP